MVHRNNHLLSAPVSNTPFVSRLQATGHRRCYHSIVNPSCDIGPTSTFPFASGVWLCDNARAFREHHWLVMKRDLHCLTLGYVSVFDEPASSQLALQMHCLTSKAVPDICTVIGSE
ncbi:hypothetical protein Y032_0314g2240 [Ancylostoma ceylanicum]|nr:hypothetical protein Y032_0314g2240 [Ancylostoma ceylanicum]